MHQHTRKTWWVAIFIVIAAQSVKAQLEEDPGNLFVGTALPLLGGPYFELCTYISFFTESQVEIWGRFPSEETSSGVSFTVEFSGAVGVVDRTTASANITDVSEPGDDHWELQFDECMGPPFQSSSYEFVRLLVYTVIWFGGSANPLMCTSPTSQPEPTWQLCSGGEYSGGRFPVGFAPFPDGCFALNGAAPFCGIVATQESSWSAMKARY